jgi:hypothetical protein
MDDGVTEGGRNRTVREHQPVEDAMGKGQEKRRGAGRGLLVTAGLAWLGLALAGAAWAQEAPSTAGGPAVQEDAGGGVQAGQKGAAAAKGEPTAPADPAAKPDPTERPTMQEKGKDVETLPPIDIAGRKGPQVLILSRLVRTVYEELKDDKSFLDKIVESARKDPL